MSCGNRDRKLAASTETEDGSDEDEEELSFLEACQEGDEDMIYDVIQDGLSGSNLNERDKNGRTGFSYVCASGMLPILELLITLEELDPNLPDNDGNTPLIYAAQAGHDEIVNFLLQNYSNLRLDHSNKIGLTALIKASIQGRTKCAKLLLFAGANPNKQDTRRGLKPEQWARFCGRPACSDAIARYLNSKKYFFKKTFILPRERSTSVPDLRSGKSQEAAVEETAKRPGWLARHFSFKRKKGCSKSRGATTANDQAKTPLDISPLEARCSSSPQLEWAGRVGGAGGEASEDSDPCSPVARRPSCVDCTALPLNLQRYKGDADGGGGAGGGACVSPRQLLDNSPHDQYFRYPTPPRILETDYDLDKLTTIGVG